MVAFERGEVGAGGRRIARGERRAARPEEGVVAVAAQREAVGVGGVTLCCVTRSAEGEQLEASDPQLALGEVGVVVVAEEAQALVGALEAPNGGDLVVVAALGGVEQRALPPGVVPEAAGRVVAVEAAVQGLGEVGGRA